MSIQGTLTAERYSRNLTWAQFTTPPRGGTCDARARKKEEENTINKCFPEADPQTKVGATTLIEHHPASLVSSLEDRLDQISAGGFVLIFTDGSSEKHPTVGDIAGYGVYSECGIRVSAYVPIDQRQTNRTAELLSSIKALQATDDTDAAICIDSSYFHLGATGAARRWKVRGSVGSAGTRVCNVTLWEEFFVELDKPGRPFVFPSHFGIAGNTQADLLANAGRLQPTLSLAAAWSPTM